MNEFLQYLLNSAICLSTLYLLFRILMRKEAFFKLNRIVLLSIVICSLLIPKLIIPQFIPQTIHQPIELQLPVFILEDNILQKLPASDETVLSAETIRSSETQEKFSLSHLSINKMLFYSYIAGLLITFLTLFYGIISIFILYRKAKVIRMDGFRLLIVEKEIAAFSFGRLVYISQSDYKEHGQVILAHEKEHIRSGHFYDLFFLEVNKIIFWFNPFIYWLIRDLKEIHEFQADNHTLTTGIDATKYQLLIIQKSVGTEKFALANSFNHCQIKNRIAMMNKQKSGKAWCWKVATFLPLLALLLMAFGKPGENDSTDRIGTQASIKADYREKARGADALSDILIPERNTLLIQVNAKEKVFVGIEGEANKQKLLTKMGEVYHLVFSPKELKEFSLINGVGVPMNLMKAFLNLTPEERDKPENAPGIPFDSPVNEFKYWVSTARTLLGKEMKIKIKGDQATSYPTIRNLMRTLQDLNEKQYTVTLGKEPFMVKASMAVTIIIDKGNSIYYYEGTRDEKKGIDPVVTKTDFLGIRRYLINKNLNIMLKVNDLRKKKQDLKLSNEDFEKQRKEILSAKTGPVVIIKATNAASYGNIVSILDEMGLCNISRYAIVDISDYDINLIKKARIELNPPAFSVQNQKEQKN